MVPIIIITIVIIIIIIIMSMIIIIMIMIMIITIIIITIININIIIILIFILMSIIIITTIIIIIDIIIIIIIIIIIRETEPRRAADPPTDREPRTLPQGPRIETKRTGLSQKDYGPQQDERTTAQKPYESTRIETLRPSRCLLGLFSNMTTSHRTASPNMIASPTHRTDTCEPDTSLCML